MENRENTFRDVNAVVNYLADPAVEDPSRWLQFWVNDKSRSNMRTEPHRVAIRDARPIADRLDLDREGFRLVRHRSAATNYRDAEEVGRVQPAELEALVRELTGAARTVCFGPQMRLGGSLPPEERTLAATRGIDSFPARFVHNDFTDEGIHWMCDGADVRLDNYSRYACFNVWRSITPPPQDLPLAFCAADGIAPGDEVEALTVLDAPEMAPQLLRSLTAVYRPSSAHRWYYFPDMSPDEVVVFKTYDSDRGRARAVAHSAFEAPDCPPDVPPRRSVEARIVALFDS